MRRESTEKRGRIDLLERLIEDKKDDLKRETGREKIVRGEKAQLEGEIACEQRTLSVLEADLYERELRLKDLKAELSAALMQVQCKGMENREIEVEYQESLQECRAKQEEQRCAVTQAIAGYRGNLEAAKGRIWQLNEQLRELRRGGKRVARVQADRPEYGSVVAGVVGVACGVLLQAFGALRLAIA